MLLKNKKDKQEQNDEIMRYRMSDRDVFYGGGVVNGARSLTLMEEVADRIMARDFGYVNPPAGVYRVRLFAPSSAGDYTEMHGRILEEKDGLVRIEVRQFTVAGIPENPEHPSSIDVFEEPRLATAAIFEYKVEEK